MYVGDENILICFYLGVCISIDLRRETKLSCVVKKKW